MGLFQNHIITVKGDEMSAIYSTCNEKAMLRFEGPYRITVSYEALYGMVIPEEITISSPIVISQMIIRGQEIAFREENIPENVYF